MPDGNLPDRLLTPTQAAEMLGVSPASLAVWRSGRVPGKPAWVKHSGRCYYRLSVLEKFIAAGDIDPNVPEAAQVE